MNNNAQTFCPEKINIILTSIPSHYSNDFMEITESYFKDYKDNVGEFLNLKGETEYYKVLRYHIFGSYDIGFITLSESDKFAQKIFAPLSNNIKVNEYTLPFSYKIISGITNPIISSFDLNKCFRNLRTDDKDQNDNNVFVYGKYKYCLICNLKLNVGHLLGGGLDYFELVEKKMVHFIREKIDIGTIDDSTPVNKFILTRTFSWADLNLIAFCDKIENLLDLVIDLRGITFNELFDKSNESENEVLEKTLHHKLGYDKEKIKSSHVFIETQSYFGVEYNKFVDDKDDSLSDDFITQIELKVKSGHENEVVELIKNNTELQEIFRNDDSKFIFGSTDLTLIEENNSISNNKTANRIFKEKLFEQHIRKMYTRVMTKFPKNSDNNDSGLQNVETIERINDFIDKMAIFTIKSEEISEINDTLKELKVPRHFRQKIIKVFYSYNMGILDPVLNLSFQDFYDFMKSFKNEILVLGSSDNVDDIEKRLERRIRSFDKAFQSRILNTYLYEEMGDIDIDYQSSIQKLLSIYSSLANMESDIFTGDKIYTAKIVNAYQKNTNANLFTINFNIHHLTSPEFIYISLHKEILNPIIQDKDKIITELHNVLKNTLTEDAIKQFKLENLDKNNIRNLLIYVLIDIIRVKTTFGNQLDLYYYYSWYFNFQNASLYSTKYFMKVENFVFELKRIMLVIYIHNKESIKNLWRPTIELANDWECFFNNFRDSLINSDEFDFYNLKKFKNDLYKKYTNNLIFAANDIFKKLDKNFTDQISKFNNKLTLNDFAKLKIDKYKSLFELYNECIKIYEKNKNNSNLQYFSIIYRLISFKYLEKIYKFNTEIDKLNNVNELKNLGKDIKIDLLKRSWKTGKPLELFLDNDRKNAKSLYLLDNQGGIFFIEPEKLKKYYELRDDYFKVLMDINLRIKNEKFLKQYKNQQNENIMVK